MPITRDYLAFIGDGGGFARYTEKPPFYHIADLPEEERVEKSIACAARFENFFNNMMSLAESSGVDYYIFNHNGSLIGSRECGEVFYDLCELSKDW